MDNPLLDRLRATRQTETTKRKSLADERIEEAAAQGAFDNLDGQGKPLSPKATDPNKKQPPLTAARVGNIAEQRIQAAMEDGMFENLPGAGKPLRLRHLDDPDWFAKQLLEREQISGVLPGPLALRKERRAIDQLMLRQAG